MSPSRGRSPGGAGVSGGAGARGAILLAVAVVLGVVLLQAFDTGIDSSPVPVTVVGGGTTRSTAPPRATTTVAPPPTTRAPRPPPEVKVLAANGTAIRGLGAKTSEALKAVGYNTLAAVDATKALDTTTIQFDQGFEPEARAIATILGLAQTVVGPLSSPPVPDTRGANVIVLLGADVTRTTTTAATTTTRR